MTDTTATIERPTIAGAQYLPVNLCKGASFNPRKRFDPATLEKLADSIQKVGLMQPVVARLIAGAKRGAPLYEIVAGERRLRACRIVAERRGDLDIAVIPAIVNDLSDFEALELATTENFHRDDLHALEEAEGFEGLLLRPIGGGEFNPPRARGYTVDELAERYDVSRGYVFASLKLLQLIPAAREAFLADKFGRHVAIQLARMPAAVQADALKRVVQGWGGDPLTARAASELLQREFMLKLGSAPFKITDESLVPGAGNCRECPKRTGANPDLFDDVKGADVCTDPACYQAKKDAHQARLIEQARDDGREVIVGTAAKKVMPSNSTYSLKGYKPLNEVDYNLPGGKTLKQHLGKDAPATVLLENPHTHDLIEVVRDTEALQALKDKGIVSKGARSTSVSAEQRKAEEKAKAETAWRITLAERAVAAIVTEDFDELDVHTWLLPQVALAMWNRLDHETGKRARKLLGWDKDNADAEKHIAACNSAQLDQAFVAMTIAGQLHVGQYSDSKPTRLLAIAGRLGIDGAAVRAELDAASKAKAVSKSKAAKPMANPTARPKPAAKAAVKFRDAATGETWSGRGLKPKWLTVALANGKTLADFAADTTATPMAPQGGKGAKPKGSSSKKNPPPAGASAKDEEGESATAKAVEKASGLKTPASGGVVSAAAAWPFPEGDKP